LEYVYPGAYRLDQLAQQSGSAYYLDAVRLGETEIAPAMRFPTSLTLVYKTGGGSVRALWVLIAADPSARWQGFERSMQCDSNDRYEVNSLRPGDYYAVAHRRVRRPRGRTASTTSSNRAP